MTDSGMRVIRQHIISSCLLKQWGDDVRGRNTKVGYVDFYQRDRGTISVNEAELQPSLTPNGIGEQEWNEEIERPGDGILNKVRQAMSSSHNGFNEETKRILADPESIAALRRLVALHWARSYAVFLRNRLEDPCARSDPAESRLADITRRLSDALGRYGADADEGERSFGVQYSTPAEGYEFLIGQFPVFDLQDWKTAPHVDESHLASFMMPLTPHLSITGTSLPNEESTFVQLSEETTRLAMQQQIGSQPVSPIRNYCRPSYLPTAERLALDFTHGGYLHWEGLKDRLTASTLRPDSPVGIEVMRILHEHSERWSAYMQLHSRSAETEDSKFRDVSDIARRIGAYQQWAREAATRMEELLATTTPASRQN